MPVSNQPGEPGRIHVLATVDAPGPAIPAKFKAGKRQSLQFEAFLARRSERAGGIRIEVVSNDRFASTRRYAYPGEDSAAGDWNIVATRNNRVEYEFMPEVGDG